MTCNFRCEIQNGYNSVSNWDFRGMTRVILTGQSQGQAPDCRKLAQRAANTRHVVHKRLRLDGGGQAVNQYTRPVCQPQLTSTGRSCGTFVEADATLQLVEMVKHDSVGVPERPSGD